HRHLEVDAAAPARGPRQRPLDSARPARVAFAPQCRARALPPRAREPERRCHHVDGKFDVLRAAGRLMTFDRIAVGDVHDFGAHTFTLDEIKRFAHAYDPQSFHVDEEAAAKSLFGGLCASGWHTASVMMRQLVNYFRKEAEAAAARGEAFAPFGPSPGFDDLKWLRPVFPGDTIRYVARVVAKRASQSRPGWGILSIETTATNQKGEPVMVVTGHVFLATAGKG